MPRRDFIADAATIDASMLPDGIVDFRAGEDDGGFVFQFVKDGVSLDMQAMIPEVSEYPEEHSWFVYTTSDGVSPDIDKALDDADFGSLRIQAMLSKLTTILTKTLNKEEDDEDDTDLESLKDEDEDDDSAFDDDVLFDGIVPGEEDNSTTGKTKPADGMGTKAPLDAAIKKDLISRIVYDLGLAKKAGFRVSYAGSIYDGSACFIMLSCRIAKLGIQDDTLRAWHMPREKYVMLIIRYPYGYLSLGQALGKQFAQVSLRVVIADRFKMSYSQAMRLIEKEKKRDDDDASKPVVEDPTKVQMLFIDHPLNEFLNQRLIQLIRYRLALRMGWRGAEEYYLDHLGWSGQSEYPAAEKYYVHEETPPQLPKLVTTDHLTDHSFEEDQKFSLPLVAMQLTLRHLVRCVEFCQVCHGRVPNTFEALKPYVCDKPLCLYQYMSLGIGTSIETEIIAQPDVVDLLVSFCYRAAVTGCITAKLPVGLQLIVPPLPDDVIGSPGTQERELPGIQIKVFAAKYDEARNLLCEIRPKEGYDVPKIKEGDWLYLTGLGIRAHCRAKANNTLGSLPVGPLIQAVPRDATIKKNVTEKHQTPMQRAVTRVQAYQRAHTANTGNATAQQDACDGEKKKVDIDDTKPKSPKSVMVALWSLPFDSLDKETQEATVVNLLNMLPPVQEMRDYILQKRQPMGALGHWGDRLPAAVVNVLRWIIASNRSCIIQVDGVGGSEPTEPGLSELPEGFVLFRFAQGAPDKEQRFVDAVLEANKRQQKEVPTIFAWHGSSLSNWHSIIREGLNFSKTVHGRAYGDGVYHSLDLEISLGYSMVSVLTKQRSLNNKTQTWPQTRLGVSSALCLNEIVNAPNEFRSSSPHLVVQHIDWIQTRYLIVKCDKIKSGIERKQATEFLTQDASLRPKAGSGGVGLSGLKGDRHCVGIPATAIPLSRRAQVKEPGTSMAVVPSKKRKRDVAPKTNEESGLETAKDPTLSASEASLTPSPPVPTDMPTPVDLTDEYESEDSDVSDTALYTPSLHAELCATNPSEPKNTMSFRPGLLDFSTLILLKEPGYATPSATKTLQRELKRILELQMTVPLRQLGWYLDPDHVENIYQWIFELHSFDLDLPLASDLKEMKLQSVILEMRFGPTFPYAPPFVRVVRPRFVPFQLGGGGHVTIGGAMCMELLTNNGWVPASTIEAVLLQVRVAITSTDPRPARLETLRMDSYGIGEAVNAFTRAAYQHGWAVPRDLSDISAI